jgi:hypothetical protein
VTTTPDHHHTPQEERANREAALDRTIENTFPASDPLSTIPNPDAEGAEKRDAEAGETGEDAEEDAEREQSGTGM